MTGFFTGQAGGGAPVASWKARGIGDGIAGPITDLTYVPKKKFNSEEVELDPAGNKIQQLRVTIQAAPDNYATAAKQLIDDETKMPIPDDGKRAIYIARDTNISFATARALAVHQLDDLQVGATFAVQLKGEIDTGKGNPAKDHEVWYTPPAQSAGFGQFQQQQPPAQQAAPQQYQQPAQPQAAPQQFAQPAPQQAFQQPAQPQAAPQQFAQPAPQQAFQQPAQPQAAPQQFQQPAPQQAFQQPAQPQAAPQQFQQPAQPQVPQQSYQQQIQNAPQVPAPAGQTLFADQPPF